MIEFELTKEEFRKGCKKMSDSLKESKRLLAPKRYFVYCHICNRRINLKKDKYQIEYYPDNITKENYSVYVFFCHECLREYGIGLMV